MVGTVPCVLKKLWSHFDYEAVPYPKQLYFISQPCRSLLNLSLTGRSPLFMTVRLSSWCWRGKQKRTENYKAVKSIRECSGVIRRRDTSRLSTLTSEWISLFWLYKLHLSSHLHWNRWVAGGREQCELREVRWVHGISIHCSVNAISLLGTRQNKYFPTE